jgi:uncharacterized FlgJ-related protein
MNNKARNTMILLGIVAVTLFLFKKQVKQAIELTKEKLIQIMSLLKGYNEEQSKRAYQAGMALKNIGLDNERISWVMGQIAFETGHYKNTGALKDNNLTGIKYFGQSGASAGSPAPANEGKNPYAHYDSIDSWAKDYLRIMNNVGKYRPLEASSVDEFVTRLKKNGYFGGDLNSYIKGVKQLSTFYKPFISIL